MTQDHREEITPSRTDVLRMAREAGLIQYVQVEKTCVSNALERFAALVAEPWIETNKALAKEIIEMKKQAEQEPVGFQAREIGEGDWFDVGLDEIARITGIINSPILDYRWVYAAPVSIAKQSETDSSSSLMRTTVRIKDLTDAEIHEIKGYNETREMYDFAHAVIRAYKEKQK